MVVAVELVAWWAVAVGIWMASLSAYSGHDLLVACACAFPCATAAVVGRRVVRGAWRPPGELLRWLPALLVSMVTDAARVLAWPLRRSAGGGTLRTVDVAGVGDDAAGAGRRAFVTFLLCSTPGTYVLAADEERGTLTVHTLGEASLLERRVAR